MANLAVRHIAVAIQAIQLCNISKKLRETKLKELAVTKGWRELEI